MSKFFVEDIKHKYKNPETGEELEYSGQKTVQIKDAEPFFLTYSRQILALYNTDVLNATTKVLYKFMEFAEWNTGKVYVSAGRIEEIMEVCHISRASYQRAVRELIDKRVIIKEKGAYTIAEDMFWKGELKMRERVLKAKMQITFTPILQEKGMAE